MHRDTDHVAGVALRSRLSAELLTKQFYRWEQRGRGWLVHPRRVTLEPPFTPFRFHSIARPIQRRDDGIRPTILSRLTDRLIDALKPSREPGLVLDLKDEEPEAHSDEAEGSLAEFSVVLPPSVDVSLEAVEHLLTTLPRSERPLAFEMFGEPGRIAVQFACSDESRTSLRQHLAAAFPEAAIISADGALLRAWSEVDSERLVAEYGLSEEFMIPLRVYRSLKLDPLSGIGAALSDLQEREVGVLQVLLQPVKHPWAESIRRAVLDDNGSPFFLDAPEITSLANDKLSRPLFACVIRVAAKSPTPGRATVIARELGWALNALANPPANRLIPLSNTGYPDPEHETDLLERRTHRSGMILGSAEVASLVHPPSASVQIEKLVRQARRTRPAPQITAGHALRLGMNEHIGRLVEVGLSEDQRSRHIYVVGASGTGKSTLLLNCILQDLEAGAGLAVLDPHGDLIDEIVQRCPPERADDVVLLDPADAEYPIGFNILTAHSELERTLLSSDLVSVFRRLSTSWGDQMTSVLGNAIQALLESDRGGTLIDLRRFLVEGSFRKEFLKGVKDPEVVYYWEREFPLLSGKPQAPLLTRLDTFLRPKPIRYMVAQKESRLDLRKLMDSGGVLLCRLSQGAIGEENAYLLGTLLVSKLHQIAISRQQMAAAERKPFYLYIDEFQNFVTPSMEAILSGARKYRLGLILAHQELRQIGSRSPEVLSSVLSNPYTRICFRVGDDDARKLADGFAHFTAQDLQSLGTGEAIVRVERAEYDFNLRTEPLSLAPESAEHRTHERIVSLTRERYARPRSEVEGTLHASPAEPVPAPVFEPPTAPHVRPPRTRAEPLAALPETAPATVPVDPAMQAAAGRGGAQHRYLQELIRQWGEANGWRATIEESVLDDSGRVDVVLRNAKRSIACEVAVTTSASHELQNVRKCLTVGFERVLVVSPARRLVAELRQEASKSLPPAELKRVEFCSPEEMFGVLDALNTRGRTSEQTVRGYRVKVRVAQDPARAPGAVRSTIAEVMVKALRRMKGKR